jgi:hypothetical protein
MNKLKLYLVAMMACCLGFTACGDDDDYEVGAQSEGTVSFGTASANATVTTGAYSLDIDLYRKDTASALDVPLTVVSADEVFTIPSSAHFNAGESKTSITVDFPEAELAVYYTFTIRIPEQYANVYATSLLQRTIYRDYTWIDLPGHAIFEFDDLETDVTIQKADGFRHWRLVNPLKPYYGSAADSYITFDINSDGSVVFETYKNGSYSDGSQIYAFWPLDLKDTFTDYAAESTMLDDYTVQLAPYYYIPGVGGWGVYYVTFTLDEDSPYTFGD